MQLTVRIPSNLKDHSKHKLFFQNVHSVTNWKLHIKIENPIKLELFTAFKRAVVLNDQSMGTSNKRPI